MVFYRWKIAPTDNITFASAGFEAGESLVWSYDFEVYFFAVYSKNTYNVTYNYAGGEAETDEKKLDSAYTPYLTTNISYDEEVSPRFRVGQYKIVVWLWKIK